MLEFCGGGVERARGRSGGEKVLAGMVHTGQVEVGEH